MKKLISFLLSLTMLLSLLAACGPSGEELSQMPEQPSVSAPPEEPSESSPALEGLSCAEVMAGILGALDMEDSPTTTYGADGEEPEQLAAYLEETYGLSEGEWVDAYVARKDKSSGMEMAVVRCAGEDAAAHALECLEAYRAARQKELDVRRAGRSLDRTLMRDAVLLCRGEYAALLSCYGRAYAAQVFTEMVDTGEVPEPVPMKQDMDAQMDMLLAFCEAEGDDVSSVERINSGDMDRLRAIIEGEYGLTDAPWVEAVIARGTGGSVFEIALVRFEDDLRAGYCMRSATEYLDAKEEEYARFPAQAKLLNEAEVTVPFYSHCLVFSVSAASVFWEFGQYLTDGMCGSFQVVLRHEDAAAAAPRPSAEPDPDYPGRLKFTPPNEEDMSLYDTAALRAAWENNDPAGLSDTDRAVYDAAKEILGEILRDGMTGLEKEEAIYRWVVDHVDYDWGHMDVLMETPRTSYEPYGALVDRLAVCLGYATGFQLLCDFAGVECITVVGACSNSTGDHAWNMVRLDETWYCVDVTWDANNRELQGEGSEWIYFNVTSERMAKDHQWDYANTPEAT